MANSDSSTSTTALSELSHSDEIIHSDHSHEDMKQKGSRAPKNKLEKEEGSEAGSQAGKRKRGESHDQRGRSTNCNGPQGRKRIKSSTNSQARKPEKVQDRSSSSKESPKTGEKKASATAAVKKQPMKKGAREAKESQDRAATAETEGDEPDVNSVATEAGRKKGPKKRKTKEEKQAEAMPISPRSTGLRHFIGAHVSSAGGVHNAVTNAIHIGGNAFAMFLKSQRKWANPPLSNEHADSFRASCKSHSYKSGAHVLPHGSYLVNLAHTDPERAKQAYDGFLDDLGRCNALGINLYNFHPGNSAASSKEEAIDHLAKQLNAAHKDPKSGKVITVLETMAGMGNVIGATFDDLQQIIDRVEDKERVGVCLDTCHIYAAGYDLCGPLAFKKTLDEFESIIGLKYLKALHVNDSKAPLGSNRDLHANIGTGFLGLRAFHSIMNEKRFEGLPLVLETPTDSKNADGKVTEDKSVWAREIKLLESLVDMDVNDSEFKEMEEKLAAEGIEERKRIDDQVKRREEKAKAKPKKRQKKSSQNTSTEESG